MQKQTPLLVSIVMMKCHRGAQSLPDELLAIISRVGAHGEMLTSYMPITGQLEATSADSENNIQLAVPYYIALI